MKNDRLKNVKITKLRAKEVAEVDDVVLKERPLTIKANDDPFVTVMCTPGNEIELAAGLLLAEGVIDSKNDLATIRFCSEEGEDVVEVKLIEAREKIAKKRIEAARGISRSSCGICGRELIEDVSSFTQPVESDLKVNANWLIELQAKLGDEYQQLYKQTGAAHSAALLDEDGNVLAFAEDVGRHNALDKVIGRIVLQPPERKPAIAILSSRASFEMIQKIARAVIPIACFTSAPTDMAVELADKFQITLVGFLRSARLNIYTHQKRIVNS